MAAFAAAPEAVLFGAERDLRLLRIAHTNLAIHGITAYLLHADYREHELALDTADGEYNWKQANSWKARIDCLKSKEPGEPHPRIGQEQPPQGGRN